MGDLDFRIVDIDTYSLLKENACNLAKSYRIKFNPDPSRHTSSELKKKLAVVKRNIVRAKEDPSYEDLVKHVFANGVLSAELKEKFPELVELHDTLDDTYENKVYNSSTTLQLGSQQFHTYSNSSKLFEPDRNQISPDIHYEEVQYNNAKVTVNQHLISINDTSSPSTKTEKLETNFENLESPSKANIQSAIFKPRMEEQLPLIKATTFSGLSSECPNEFLNKFELAANCNKWKEETKLSLFPAHLIGNPYRWFQIYKSQNARGIQWDQLKTDFLTVFSPMAMVQDALSILESRTQQKDENTLQFMFEIIHLCKRVDNEMTESKIINYFLQAVRPEVCGELVRMKNNTLAELQTNVVEIEKQNLFKARNLRRYSDSPVRKLEKKDEMQDTLCQANVDPVYVLRETLREGLSEVRQTLSNLSMEKPKVRFSRREDFEDRSKEQEPRFRSKSPHYRDGGSRSRDRRNSHSRDRSASSSYPRNYPQSSRNRTPSRDNRQQVYCHICDRSTHSTQICYFNAKNKDRNRRESYDSKRQQNRYCGYCRSNTHSFERCFKKPQGSPQKNVGTGGDIRN